MIDPEMNDREMQIHLHELMERETRKREYAKTWKGFLQEMNVRFMEG